ncbi:MAG: hypothetical protein KAT04_12975 [Methylococcales bacterium]|nr:hypothetical protein [Methylococcales bacterium]
MNEAQKFLIDEKLGDLVLTNTGKLPNIYASDALIKFSNAYKEKAEKLERCITEYILTEGNRALEPCEIIEFILQYETKPAE